MYAVSGFLVDAKASRGGVQKHIHFQLFEKGGIGLWNLRISA